MPDTVESLTARLAALEGLIAEAETSGPTLSQPGGVTFTRQPYADLIRERNRVRLRLSRLTRISRG